MMPAASVSGLYFANPESRYFAVGKICKDHLRGCLIHSHVCGGVESECLLDVTQHLFLMFLSSLDIKDWDTRKPFATCEWLLAHLLHVFY